MISIVYLWEEILRRISFVFHKFVQIGLCVCVLVGWYLTDDSCSVMNCVVGFFSCHVLWASNGVMESITFMIVVLFGTWIPITSNILQTYIHTHTHSITDEMLLPIVTIFPRVFHFISSFLFFWYCVDKWIFDMGIYAPFYVLYDVPCLNGG